MLRTELDPEKRHMVCCVIAMQWHLITRIDDMMKLQLTNLMFNLENPFTVLAKLRWSKNITEERDAPEQIVFGSMEPLLCPILNLAIYIETRTNDSPFVFGNPINGHTIVRKALQAAVGDVRFKRMKDGKLGTHSFRKGAATYASRAGAIKDHVDRRGRWRRKKATVDIYIDTNLPYPDALVASTLTGPGGPCYYKITGSSQFLPDDVLTSFVPNALRDLPQNLALVLAKALIWASVADHDTPIMPHEMKNGIKQRIYELTGLTDNPIGRIPIHVSGAGGQMHLIEVYNEEQTTLQQSTTSEASGAVLISSVLQIKKRMEEIHNTMLGEIHRLRADLSETLARLQANVRRIATAPVVRSVNQEMALTTRQKRKLLGTPKNLYDLWKEYEFGLSGNKPAKSLTSAERGQCRHTYSRRKIFWDVIENLVRKGYSSDTAIDRTYLVYGRRNSVNTILLHMRGERKNGEHPDLK